MFVLVLHSFTARELQQRGQLRLAYVAFEANTADIFTKALAPGDHQRFCTLLDCVLTPCPTMNALADIGRLRATSAGSILSCAPSVSGGRSISRSGPQSFSPFRMPGGNTQVLSSRRFCSPSGSRARSSPSSHADRRNSMCDRRTSLFGQRLPCDGSRTTTSMRVRSRKSRRGDDRHRAEGEGVTRGTPSLVCSSKVDDVPHLSEWIPDLQTYTNPLVLNPAYAYVE
ncbi:unnamed protein product [Closterium sp. NIES-54]